MHGLSQAVFKTIVPQKTVIVGESFPVQFVVEDMEKEDDFIPPVFKNFKLVSGPYVYGGSIYGMNGSRNLKNVVFTLEAIRPGRFIITGGSARIKGRFIKSNNAFIDVITKREAFEKATREDLGEKASEYFLAPGEDPYEKIKNNLFLKVSVDKNACYVGEPVVATFKLYSRLESRSDIVKNPGFYGFAVQDIITLGDNLTETEMVNGKPFDVHTIRKVQLYPLQAGLFMVDPMEVTNKVEFSKSVIGKRTEQEITEGVYEDNDNKKKDNTVTYENNISTEKIPITVKPYPSKNKPRFFNDATGSFSIHASVSKDSLGRNEEGSFVITIRGRGNFTQVTAPVVQWPQNVEGFEPVSKDSLDKTQAPLRGARAFRYSFVSDKAGNYTIPPISFSFFDPGTNSYKTVSTSPTSIAVGDAEIKRQVNNEKIIITKQHRSRLLWWIAGGFLALLAIAIAWLLKRKKPDTEVQARQTEDRISIDRLLQPAQFALKAEDSQFYRLLQTTIWEYLGNRLQLTGSKMNKQDLYATMKRKKLDEDLCVDILAVLQRCEASVFTKAEFGDDRQDLLDKTKRALEKVNSVSAG